MLRTTSFLFSRAPFALAFILCAAATFILRARADRLRAIPEERSFDIPPFPAEVSRPFSFGLRSVAADFAFLGALQNYGGQRGQRTAAAGTADDRALNRLLVYATDLDEKFGGAYRFAGSAMPRHTADGKVTNVLQAETLLKKGLAERPEDWRIPFALGFIQSFYLGHFQDAGHNLATAGKAPGAPAYLPLLATRMLAEGGEVDFAEKMARVMEDQATEEAAKEEWRRRLLDLRMERDLRALDSALQRYQELKGERPHSLADLISVHALEAIPPEPHGGRYMFGADGRPRSSVAERLTIRGRRGTMSGMEVQ